MAQIMLGYIKDQPEIWKAIVEQRKDITTDFVASHRDKEIKRIVMVGSGSSYNASCMAQEFFQRALGIEVVPAMPTRLDSMMPYLDPETTLYWAISQSGKSTSTIWTIEDLHKRGLKVTAVTANADSPIAGMADEHVLIGCGLEAVGPKTKGMTSTALTLYLMGMELCLAKGTLSQEVYDKTIADLLRAFALASGNIENSIAWTRKNSGILAAAPHIIVVAEGMNYPVSLEGALKLLETLYIPVFTYEFEEYMHGVVNTVDDNSYMIYLVSNSHNRERMLKLDQYTARYGSHNLIVSNGAPTGVENELYIETSGNDYTLPFETLLPFHTISALVSEDKGINCDKGKFPDFLTMGTKEMGTPKA